MKCKNCNALQWHPNKGFYCTVPDCAPNNAMEDVKEIYDYVMGDNYKIASGGRPKESYAEWCMKKDK